MKPISAATLRRFWPAIAVTTLLVLSLVLPSTPLGASEGVAYGYGNNCGVKGSGYHDHGKPCRNRPFPGRGVHRSDRDEMSGAHDSDEDNMSPEATEDSTSVGHSTSHGNGNAKTLNTSTTTSEDTEQSPGNGHHGKGKGKGHSKGRG